MRIELSSAKMLLEVLYKYALPWLFGLLGSCAYVLRRLENDLKSGSFSSKSPTFYSLRLVLGPLAGIAIGLLFVPSAQNAVFDTTNILDLAALSPLAVAFVAGYSVELIFSILDRIVNAFIKS